MNTMQEEYDKQQHKLVQQDAAITFLALELANHKCAIGRREEGLCVGQAQTTCAECWRYKALVKAGRPTVRVG